MKAETALARLAGGSLWGPRMPGGIPDVSADEIRGALGGLTDLQCCLVMLAWMQDYASYRPAIREAMVLLSADDRIQAWRDKPRGHLPGLLQAFVAVAIAEVCMPALCQWCRGTGRVAGGGKQCRKCQGEGGGRLSRRVKAAIASRYREMSVSTWMRLAQEYEYQHHVYEPIHEQHGIAIRRVQRSLIDP